MKKDALITYIIIGINIIVFMLESFAGGSTNSMVAYNFGVLYTPVVFLEPRRLFTAMFLHFGIFHLAMNMLCLYNIGPFIEHFFGKGKYLLIYLFSGFFGNLTVYGRELYTGSYSLTAGASGAIFGILGAILAFVIILKKESYAVNPKQIIYSIIYSLAPGVLIPGISLTAHLGGLAGGFVITYILLKTGRKNKKMAIE